MCVYRNYGVGRPEIEEIGMHEIRGGGGCLKLGVWCRSHTQQDSEKEKECPIAAMS